MSNSDKKSKSARSRSGPKLSKSQTILVIGMLIAVLLGGLGFVYKIVQFMKETHGIEGATFIVPVAIYACMALGFICLLAWATSKGMFHNIEGPKIRLLEKEEEYERNGL